MEDRYNVECCELMHAHDEIVERVQKEMREGQTLFPGVCLYVMLEFRQGLTEANLFSFFHFRQNNTSDLLLDTSSFSSSPRMSTATRQVEWPR